MGSAEILVLSAKVLALNEEVLVISAEVLVLSAKVLALNAEILVKRKSSIPKRRSSSPKRRTMKYPISKHPRQNSRGEGERRPSVQDFDNFRNYKQARLRGASIVD